MKFDLHIFLVVMMSFIIAFTVISATIALIKFPTKGYAKLVKKFLAIVLLIPTIPFVVAGFLAKGFIIGLMNVMEFVEDASDWAKKELSRK